MAGRYVSEIEIKTNVEKALKQILELQKKTDDLENKEYKIDIGVDSQKLEKVIGSLEKMLDSLGKGTGDFKQFENLSKELTGITSDIQSLSKAFGKVDDSGTKTLLSSIQSIDKSLSDLSQHITGVNADFGSIGKNASDNVGQINEAKKATEGLTDATKDLAKAQQNLNGNKSNISSDNVILDNQKQLKESKKLTDDNVSSLYEFIKLCQEQAKVLGETNEELKERAAYFKDENISGKVSVGTHYSGNHDNSVLEGANSDIHSHFSKYASFSETDLFNLREELKNFMVMGTDELTHLDLSGLNNEILRTIYMRYDTAVKELNQQFLNNLSIKDNLKFTEIEDIPEQIFEKAFEYAEKSSNIDYDYDNYDEFFETETRKIQEELLKGASLTDIVNIASKDISSFEVDGLPDDIKVFKEKFIEGIRGYLSNILQENEVFDPDKLINNKEFNKGRNDALRSVLEGLGVGADRLKTIDISNLEKGYNSVLNVLGLVNNEQEKVLETAQKIEIKQQTPIEDVFQNDSTSSSTVKEEASVMEQVESATEQAVQAKKDFATANEGVQNSVADSKSPLQLEAELMQQIAKDARDAVDAKKKFVEANKQVKDSAEDSNGSVKKDKYKNRKKISEDEYTSRYSDFASIANKTLTDNGNAILGNSVSTELVNGLVKVSAKIKTVDGDWKTFSAKIDADGNMFEQRFNTITKGVNKLNSELEIFGKDTVSTPKSDTQKSVDKALNQQISAWKKLESIREETEKTDPKNEKRIAELEEIKELYQKQYDEAKNILDVNQDLYNVEKQTEQLKQVQLETDAKISKYKASQKTSTVSSFQSSIDSYQSKYNQYANRPSEKQSVEYQNLLAEYNAQLNQLKTRFGELNKEEIISEDQINSFNKLKEQLDATDLRFQNVFKGDDLISVKKEIDTITQYMSKNTRISSEAKDKLRGYIEELKTKGADANVKAIHAAFLDVCDGERKAKREGQSFLDVLRDKVWYQWAAQIGSYFSLNDILRYAKEGIQTVRELDTALAEMRKVSDESASSLKRVQDASFDLANEVGTTALQIQNSIADFMRIGDSVEEAQKHALDANTLLQVSEFDNIEDATSALVSMSKAWDDIDTKHINDVLNILGNNMPIATDELASSLQRSAGTLATLGATIEEAAALTVAGNSILQDPDSVAAGELLPEYIVICRYFNIPESSYIG